MKKLSLTTLIYFLWTSTLFYNQAQTNYTPPYSSLDPALNSASLFECGSDYFHELEMENNSLYRTKMELFEQNYIQLVENGILGKNNTCDGVFTVPIVIHVVYGDDASGNPLSVGQGENLSVADIELGVAYLNEAFAGNLSCHSEPQEDIGIQFCLARRDINNNPTNGIQRYHSPDLTDLDKCTENIALKSISQSGGTPNANPWPSSQYINVWLVKEICASCSSSACGVAGYSTLAGSHGTALDGFVNEAGLWSNTCDEAKVGIHELGHYFNLYHTFQDGCPNNDCLVDGDKVCDTPPDNNSNPNSTCTPENTCQTDGDDTSGNNPLAGSDANDLRNNYMDYGQLACMYSFSAGQRMRMRAALCGPRNSLLSSAGCTDPCPDPLVVDFTSSATTVNVGDPVTFTNTSTGTDPTYEWFIDGNSSATTTDFTSVFAAQGSYEICLVMSSNNVDCFPDDICQTIEVICPFEASFEASQSDVQPGDMVTFTNTTTGGMNYEWLVDGVGQGAYTNPFTYTFNDFGGFSICLKGSDGVCETTTCQFINVGSCGSGKQGAIWYFGSFAGLDFNGGEPVALTDGQLNTIEGSATYADNNGNLLFYTDGSTVWNKNHNVMTNGSGLNGNSSSTQSAIIVPIPETTGRFYVFTVDAFGGPNGLQYSEVDLSLNGGLGDVVTGTKNVLLTTPVTEKLTAIPHCNGKDIWVVAHGWFTNVFYAYLISGSGVAPAVTSSIGTVHAGPNGGFAIGYLKASPDGSKIALAISAMDVFELYDFDNTTGMVSNYVDLSISPCDQNYGVEFSPDGSKLYGGCNTSGELYQFDLLAGSGSATDILNSAVTIGTIPNVAALQLGIDGRLYVAQFAQTILHRINVPNALGSDCDLELNAVTLSDDGSRGVASGLPNIFPAFFQDQKPTIVGPEILCSSTEEHVYTVRKNGICDGADYAFMHSGNGIIVEQVDTAITLSFPEGGVDTLIMLKTTSCGTTETDTLLIQLTPSPTFDWMDSDTLICAGSDGFIAFSTNAHFSQLVNNTSGTTQFLVDPFYTFDTPEADSCYQLNLINVLAMCTTTVDFCVYVDTAPFFEWEITDTTFCIGEEGSISFATNADSIRLINQESAHLQLLNSNTTTFSGHQADSTYTMHLIQTNTACDTMITFTVNVFSVDLGEDLSICEEGSIVLDATTDGATTYNWSPATGLSCTNCAMPTASPAVTTSYTVEVVNNNGCQASDMITVFVDESVLDLGEEETICSTESTTLDATMPNATSYNWSPATGLSCTDCAQPTAMPSATTTYTVTVTNDNNCEVTDDITVHVETCCPTSVADFTNTVYHCASEGDILPTVPDTAVILSMVDVPDNATITWSADPTIPINYTGDDCNPQSFSYLLTIGCKDNAAVALDGGTVTLTIYPEIAATNNEVGNDGSCGPTLTVTCPNYTVTNNVDNNGANPDWSAISGAGAITFTIANPAAQSNGVQTACQTEQLTADYACCATTVEDFTATHTWCASETPQLPPIPSDATILSTVDVPDQVQIQWSADPTIPIVYDYANGGCEPQTFTYTLTLTCATNPTVNLDGGTITVAIYPEIDGADPTILGAGTCAVSIAVACPNYVVTNDFDDNGATPDWAEVRGQGEITFTVTHPTAPETLAATCLTANYTTTYKCCIADAGTLTVTDELCPLETIVATTNEESGSPTHQLDTNYGFQYVLLDAEGNIIDLVEATTTNEAIFDVPVGTYGVCGLSYQLANAPDPMPSIGMALDEVGTNVTACFELNCWSTPIVVPEDFVLTTQNTTEGTNGGVTPFHYNTHELTLTGGTLPYTYHWERVGYVRQQVRTLEDGTGVVININYADNAEWGVSITDAHGCTADVVGNPLVVSNTSFSDQILDIYQAQITPTQPNQANGAIDISIGGGDYSCGIYECVWAGPHGMTATTEDINGLRYGWYRVSVTDCAGNHTEGWYWISNATATGSGFIRGKYLHPKQVFLQSMPNPLTHQTNVQFWLPTTEEAQLLLYNSNGQLMEQLFIGTVDKEQLQTIPFDAQHLASGVYIVQLITSSGNIISEKLVVAK